MLEQASLNEQGAAGIASRFPGVAEESDRRGRAAAHGRKPPRESEHMYHRTSSGRASLASSELVSLLGQLPRRWLVRPKATTLAVVSRWVFVLSAVFAFGGVAARLHRKGSLEFDARLLTWLHARRSSHLTRLMLGATALGSVEVLTPLATVVTFVLWTRHKARAALFVGITAAGSTAMNQLLKLVFGRARPDSSLHLSQTTGFAFPSGHSMASAAIYGALATVVADRYPKLAWGAHASSGLLALAVGSSRAYLHVHYPSDVATGWALGLSWPISLRGLILGR
jgi:membrane-associated phospholipid phosphatase